MHHRVGFWAAVLTVLLTAATAVAGVATPARSGPFCGPTTWACVPAPYTDVAQFIPGDYLWLIPAILLAPVFVVLMAAVHDYAPEPRTDLQPDRPGLRARLRGRHRGRLLRPVRGGHPEPASR